MRGKSLSIIDLDAQIAKLAMFRRTPRSTREETKGSVAKLADYRDGLLLAIKSSGEDHWERHPTGDEMIHVLDGAKTMEIVCDSGPPRSFDVRAGTIIVVPRGARHRSRSEGTTTMSAVPFPGEHVGLDIDDPRAVESKPIATTSMPAIIDLDAELAKLKMFRGRIPQSTLEERKGSGARLAAYRDGALLATRFAGKGHWESHLTGDELIHILAGAATLDIAFDDGPRSFPLVAGTVAVIPQSTWHRFRSEDGVTFMTATPFPSEVIELDSDDPRTSKPR